MLLLQGLLLSLAVSTGAPEAAGSPLERVGLLVDEGDVALGEGDHETAIATYEGALQEASALDEPTSRNSASNIVRLRLASAHVNAFDASSDLWHLDAASGLVDEYLASDDPADRAEALRIRQLIDDRSPRESPAGASPSEDTNDVAATPSEKPKRNPMVVGGAVACGVGGVFLVGTVVSLVIGRRAVDAYFEGPTRNDRDVARWQGRIANRAAVATGVIGGLAVISGAVLIGVGKKRARDEQLAVVPTLLPAGGGIAIAGVF